MIGQQLQSMFREEVLIRMAGHGIVRDATGQIDEVRASKEPFNSSFCLAPFSFLSS